eukprot:795343-Pelagomonas_calceolata.AAC.1
MPIDREQHRGPLGFAARARFWATGGGGSAAEASAAAAAAASDGYGGDRPGGRIIVLHDPEVWGVWWLFG